MGRQIRQLNHSTFEQLVEYLDGSFDKLNSASTAFKYGKTVNTGTPAQPFVIVALSVSNVLK